MYIEAATWRKYNANVSDRNYGDCVLRAISHALGMPYQTVHAELRKMGFYKQWSTFSRYLKLRGIEGPVNQPEDNPLSLNDFADLFQQGTYIVGVGPKGKVENHLVAVIDGEIWDSWDSRDYYVNRFWTVTTEPTEMHTADIDDIASQLKEPLEEYVQRLSDGTNYMDISIQWWLHHGDPYTYKFDVRIQFHDLPKRSNYFSGSTATNTFAIKISPRGTSEEDVQMIFKALKQKIYDWVYNIRKDIEDSLRANVMETHPKFNGYRKELVRLPEWSWPHVTYLDYDPNADSDYSDKFVVYMERLPDDPHKGRGTEVTFRADTWRELKRRMEDYRKNWSEFNYEY